MSHLKAAPVLAFERNGTPGTHGTPVPQGWGKAGPRVTWLDRLLVEDRGAMAPEVEAVPRCDRWTGPLFDPALEPLCSGLPSEEAQALREERAAILEYTGALPRAEAERRAGFGIAFPTQSQGA